MTARSPSPTRVSELPAEPFLQNTETTRHTIGNGIVGNSTHTRLLAGIPPIGIPHIGCAVHPQVTTKRLLAPCAAEATIDPRILSKEHRACLSILVPSEHRKILNRQWYSAQ